MKNIDKLYKIIDELELDELYRIRNIVNTKIEIIEQRTYNEEILYQKLDIFMNENFDSLEKRTVKSDNFIKAISDITGYEKDEILVADIFELNKNELDMNRYYPGEIILKSLDKALIKFGFNIDYKLSVNQKLILEEKRLEFDKILIK